MSKSATRDELRAVERMLRSWDPIGVIVDPDTPDGPLDEYDSFAPGVLKHLRDSSDVETLAKHLNAIATAQMSLNRALDKDREFAQRLVAWWKAQAGSKNAA